MNKKIILMVIGEPYSIFSELIFKLYKSKLLKNLKNQIVLIGSKKLLKDQMKKLNYKITINEVNYKNLSKLRLDKKNINIINVDYKYKKIFDQISNKSNNYINISFKIALKLIKKNKNISLINGPINKKTFLKKKHLGMTEFMQKKTHSKNTAMLIYNSNFAVCPITTHTPVKNIVKSLSKDKIVNKVLLIDKFYKNKLKKKPSFAVMGLNPHCETTNIISEEDQIIKPSIKNLKKRRVIISGPFSADTFFTKVNLKKYDVAIGMYHDQVLIPMKTLFDFDAINITLGLPFIRITPDHGTNNIMLGKNCSNPQSLFSAINFFKKIK